MSMQREFTPTGSTLPHGCGSSHRTATAHVRCAVQDKTATVVGAGRFAILHRWSYSPGGRFAHATYRVSLFATQAERDAEVEHMSRYHTPRCSGTCSGFWALTVPTAERTAS